MWMLEILFFSWSAHDTYVAYFAFTETTSEFGTDCYSIRFTQFEVVHKFTFDPIIILLNLNPKRTTIHRTSIGDKNRATKQKTRQTKLPYTPCRRKFRPDYKHWNLLVYWKHMANKPTRHEKIKQKQSKTRMVQTPIQRVLDTFL